MEIVYQSKDKCFEYVIQDMPRRNQQLKNSIKVLLKQKQTDNAKSDIEHYQQQIANNDVLLEKMLKFKDSPSYQIRRAEDLSCYTFQLIDLSYNNHIIRRKIIFYNDGRVKIQTNGKFRNVRKNKINASIMACIVQFEDIARCYNKEEYPDGIISKEEIDNFTSFLKTVYPYYQELEDLINMFNASKPQKEYKHPENQWYSYNTPKNWRRVQKARACVKAFEKAPKSIKKIMLASENEDMFVCSLTRFSLIRWCGFKDINIQRTLMDTKHGIHPIFRTILSFKRVACEGTNFNPELVLCNQTKHLGWEERDAISMISAIFGKQNLKRFLPEEDLEEIKRYIGSHNLKDIHDFIAPYNRKCEALKNYKEYKYNDNELEMEQTIDDISFKIPRNSVELIELGAMMHNCVASYNDNVARKYSLIVYGMDKKDSSPRCCVELRPHKDEDSISYTAIQCFAPHNKPVVGGVKEACTKFFEGIGNCTYKNASGYVERNYPTWNDLVF